MKALFTGLLCLLCLCAYGQNPYQRRRAPALEKGSITSSLDGNEQVFYYYTSTGKKSRPLIVQLHSWSYTADNLQTLGLDTFAINSNYNYIFPNFRGVNNHAKACCSEFVLADIDEAIDWAIKNMPVDKKQIYIIGYSGGGFATLAMYMKSRHTIKGFSAWAPISDLVAWYGESVERKNRFANQIIQCIGATDKFDTLMAKARSPLYWPTPVKKRKNSSLQIFAGIHDGYNDGPVPISQSINFYNKLQAESGEKDSSNYVNTNDLNIMMKTQTYPSSTKYGKLGNKTIHYQKQSKKIKLTVFEGAHDLLSEQALESIVQNK